MGAICAAVIVAIFSSAPEAIQSLSVYLYTYTRLNQRYNGIRDTIAMQKVMHILNSSIEAVVQRQSRVSRICVDAPAYNTQAVSAQQKISNKQSTSSLHSDNRSTAACMCARSRVLCTDTHLHFKRKSTSMRMCISERGAR